MPSTKDIRAWAAACGAAGTADDLVAQSLHAESMCTEWRHRVRSGLKQLRDEAVRFFHETRLSRVHSSSPVPGLLRTEGYAAGVLGISARFRELPVDDSTGAARARVNRSGSCPASWCKRPRSTRSGKPHAGHPMGHGSRIARG
ncbi:hypothetical protein [Streptomyces sp. JNUCC 63]